MTKKSENIMNSIVEELAKNIMNIQGEINQMFKDNPPMKTKVDNSMLEGMGNEETIYPS